MFFEYPFEYAEVDGLGRLFYSIIKAQLKTINGWLEFDFLVDTGADTTTIPSHLLPVLGIKQTQLKSNITFGVGGFSVVTWEFKLPIKLCKKELLIHCCAVNMKNGTMPLLLGRKDIFENVFNLLIDSKKKLTVISEN